MVNMSINKNGKNRLTNKQVKIERRKAFPKTFVWSDIL